MTIPGAGAGRLPHRRLLQLTALVSTLDRFAMPPMILAMSRDLSVPLTDVTRAAGGYFLAYGLSQPVWGLIGGRIGIVRTLRWAMVLATTATTATAFASGGTSLFVLRALAGAGFGAAVPAALFYVGDTARDDERHREVTGLMSGVALGTAVATAGAGVLATTIGWRSAFLVTGASGLVVLIALRRLPERPPLPSTGGVFAPLHAVAGSATARRLLLLAAVEGAILLGALTFLPAAAERAGSGPAVAAAVTAGFGVAVLTFAPLVGRLQRRVHPAALIGGGAVCAVAGCAAVAVSLRPLVVLIACVLLGAAWASMHSTLQTWATEVAPHAGPIAVSLFAGALFAGSAVAAEAGGRLADEGRFALLFATAALLAVPLGVVGAVSRLRWTGNAER